MICEPVPTAAVQLVPVCETLTGTVIGCGAKLIVAICLEPLGGIVLIDLVQLVREPHQLNVAINAVLFDNAAVRCRTAPGSSSARKRNNRYTAKKPRPTENEPPGAGLLLQHTKATKI